MPRTEVLTKVPVGEQPHGTGQFGVHRLLRERAQPSHERGSLGRVRVGRLMLPQIAREDVLRRELQEAGGNMLDLPPQLPQMARDRGQRNSRRDNSTATASS